MNQLPAERSLRNVTKLTQHTLNRGGLHRKCAEVKRGERRFSFGAQWMCANYSATLHGLTEKKTTVPMRSKHTRRRNYPSLRRVVFRHRRTAEEEAQSSVNSTAAAGL